MYALFLSAALAISGAGQPADTPATVRTVERGAHGDTLLLVLHIEGAPGIHVSEPYYLNDRVRIYVDLDRVTASPDSAALAALAGGNLLAIVPRPRVGGTEIMIDLREFAGYDVARSDSTIALHLAAWPVPAAVASATAPARTAVSASLIRALPRPSPILALLLVPLALAILLLRRRTPQTPARIAARTASKVKPAVQRTPEPVAPPAADARIFTAKTLHAGGANTTEIVRRTGLSKDAVQFLRMRR